MTESIILFSGSLLDRAALERRDETWIRSRLESSSARFLPFWRLNVLVRTGPPLRLAWANQEIRGQIDRGTGCVLLGVAEGVPHFAVDISALSDPLGALGLGSPAEFMDVRALAPQVPASDTATLALGRSLIDWHARHRFCAGCGGTTSSADAGYMRRCASPDCGVEHFPRTDPVAIALVSRGERCLLGRQSSWPPGMFSALAGFIEPGETLEEAVQRELLEETGVRVSRVRYCFSQPWPFPSSLMLGCRAEAESEEIVIDHKELEDARWFTRVEVQRALEGPMEPGRLWLPPPMAVAHQLVRVWVAEKD